MAAHLGGAENSTNWIVTDETNTKKRTTQASNEKMHAFVKLITFATGVANVQHPLSTGKTRRYKVLTTSCSMTPSRKGKF